MKHLKVFGKINESAETRLYKSGMSDMKKSIIDKLKSDYTNGKVQGVSNVTEDKVIKNVIEFIKGISI